MRIALRRAHSNAQDNQYTRKFPVVNLAGVRGQPVELVGNAMLVGKARPIVNKRTGNSISELGH
jgi:hypothetical protein